MPSSVFNRVRMAVASAPGTGSIALGSASSGYRTFAQAGITNGTLVNYLLEDGTAWEYGRGTWSSSGPTLARTKILGSSNAGAAINASASAIVSCDAFAEDVTNQFALISSTGDLSAAPVASVTLTGLDAYTDLTFEWAAVGHDYTTASQTFSVAASSDGTNWSGTATITASVSSAGLINGQMTISANGLLKNLAIISNTATGALSAPAIVNATSIAREINLAGPLTALRFTPSTSGNFNKGSIIAYGR